MEPRDYADRIERTPASGASSSEPAAQPLSPDARPLSAM